eukprot:1158235-Pelagomonas_calceolata.AAC.3
MHMQAKQLQQHSGGDAVHIMAHVFGLGPACKLHTKMGVVLEIAEQLGAGSPAQLQQDARGAGDRREAWGRELSPAAAAMILKVGVVLRALSALSYQEGQRGR